MHTHKMAVLAEIAPDVKCFVDRHMNSDRHYSAPAELLFPPDGNYTDARRSLLHEEADKIPAEYRAVFVLNGLTEAGLPHFHRLLATHLGDKEPWRTWNDLWTSEEDQHDGILHDYLRYTHFVDVVQVEKLQQVYLSAGFRPDWGGDPYQLIAYTVLQERATQVSHGTMAKFLKPYAPLLTRMLGYIAADEGRHALFYRDVFEKILSIDPDNGLVALATVVRKFTMPGQAVPGFNDLSYVAMRSGVFAGEHFATILEEVLKQVKIEEMRVYLPAGEEARAYLLAQPARIHRTAAYARRAVPRELVFPFLEKTLTI